MKKKVSLKDIAMKAGVSTALVSYTLNGKEKEGRVGKVMAEKIKKIALELKYRPNQLAKSLKSGKTSTLGVIVADISNPFFAQMARAIEDVAKSKGYTVIFGSSDENEGKSWDLIKVLMDKQVDGFIIAPAEGTKEHITFLRDNGIPVVLVDRSLPDVYVSSVLTNNYQIVFKAVQHLVDRGNRRIGMIASKSKLNHMEDRIKGYKDALKNAKVPIKDQRLVRIGYVDLENDMNEAIDQMLSQDPKMDALIFATNTLAIQALKRINQLPIKVPDDLRVICFDESDAFDLFVCPLTYIRQPIEALAQTSVELLIDQIETEDAPTINKSISSELIVRSSCQRSNQLIDKP